jgi:hypothetical protein
MSSINTTTLSPALTSRTVNIPRLAIEAANELDEVENGRLQESISAKKLADLLRHSFSNGNDKAKGQGQVTVKSGTVAVFCDAIESMRLDSRTDDFNEVIKTALRYAKQLNAKKPHNKDKLEETKTFCIALAKAAAGYRESVLDAQVRNRWR